MANVQRYRSGKVSEVRVKIDAGDLVEVGDLVAISGEYAKPYSVINDTTEVFHDTFCGVLVQGGTDGNQTEDTDGLVYDSGEFEFPLGVPAQAVHPAGTLVGASGDQQVDIVLVENEAIGRLAKPTKIGDTTVLVRIMSVAMAPVALTPA